MFSNDITTLNFTLNSEVPRLASVGMTPTKFHAKRKPVLTAEVSAIILVLRSLRAGSRRDGVTSEGFIRYLKLRLHC